MSARERGDQTRELVDAIGDLTEAVKDSTRKETTGDDGARTDSRGRLRDARGRFLPMGGGGDGSDGGVPGDALAPGGGGSPAGGKRKKQQQDDEEGGKRGAFSAAAQRALAPAAVLGMIRQGAGTLESAQLANEKTLDSSVSFTESQIEQERIRRNLDPGEASGLNKARRFAGDTSAPEDPDLVAERRRQEQGPQIRAEARLVAELEQLGRRGIDVDEGRAAQWLGEFMRQEIGAEGGRHRANAVSAAAYRDRAGRTGN